MIERPILTKWVWVTGNSKGRGTIYDTGRHTLQVVVVNQRNEERDMVKEFLCPGNTDSDTAQGIIKMSRPGRIRYT